MRQVDAQLERRLGIDLVAIQEASKAKNACGCITVGVEVLKLCDGVLCWIQCVSRLSIHLLKMELAIKFALLSIETQLPSV